MKYRTALFFIALSVIVLSQQAIARDDMTVATILELSWIPLRKSKTRANTMIKMIVEGTFAYPFLACARDSQALSNGFSVSYP